MRTLFCLMSSKIRSASADRVASSDIHREVTRSRRQKLGRDVLRELQHQKHSEKIRSSDGDGHTTEDPGFTLTR